jgi:hypothetical protein
VTVVIGEFVLLGGRCAIPQQDSRKKPDGLQADGQLA